MSWFRLLGPVSVEAMYVHKDSALYIIPYPTILPPTFPDLPHPHPTTDLMQVHYWTTGAIGPFVVKDPMVLGHESSGVVTSVGDSVTTLQVGDRVAMEPGVPCRRCNSCKAGTYNLCPMMAFAATPPYDGTLCKYYPLPEDLCYKLPDHVTLEEGALIEPLSVAVHIVKQAGVKPGQNVVVFGAGPVGLLCAAVSKAFGAAKIVCVDIQEGRLDFAKSFIKGSTTFIPSSSASAAENASKICDENAFSVGADIAIDASGAPPSVNTGIHVLRQGGTYVQAGMGRDEITFPIMAVCTREITVKGSFRYGSGDYKLAVELVADGKVEVGKLVSRKVSFGEAEEAFRDVKGGKGIKILIEGVKD